MALFFRDDRSYDLSVRLTGFNRYRQLMSFYASRWLVVNLFTVAGALPLAAGIAFSILSSSVLVLIPASLLGGAILGPFLAGMYDSILRGLRDAPGRWTEHYKKSWRQNAVGSLLPGALLGLFTGMFSFMAYLLYSAETAPRTVDLLLFLFSALLLLWVNTLYWPQLVLFQQRASIRLKNALLFTLRHLLPVLGAVLIQLAWLLLLVLFAPWTLLLIPFLGFWYILLVSQLLIYDHLNEDLQIEAGFIPLEGDPWAPDPRESGGGEDEL